MLECALSGALMMKSILNLTPEQKRQVEKEIGPLRTITEFCSGLLEATKEISLKDKLVSLLPWAVKGGQIVSEITPLTKVLVKLVDEIAKEKDPETLGLVACSLAYQRAAALSLSQQGEPKDRVPFEQALQSASQDLKKLTTKVDLSGFSLEAPLAHPFVWQADDSLLLVVRSVGYSENEWRQIQFHVHDQFCTGLVEVLAHGETASRFEPFTKRLSMGDNSAAHTALNAHIERQRWLFEDRPVLNIEPFTLAQVYVDPDCGKLRWKDFLDPNGPKREISGERFDPFSQKCGGRHPLLETVLGYLRDPRFNDAIVIQGASGCGKSSFTLHLANVLRREGLRPLRIRLKFLDLKKNLSEALAQVVMQPEEGEDPALARLPQCSNPFMDDLIFQERTKFGEAEICPYVLILDGWDEISVSVNEGFEIEVRRMLENVRREFLRPRSVRVRVILTGRPSPAVEHGQFLSDDTPVLTVRDYTPDQLESYVAKVRSILEHGALPAGAEKWPNTEWDNVQRALASYREGGGSLDILGLPLLAHLSLRLLAEMPGKPELLLSDRTTLYRHLLDLTCVKSGKASYDSEDLHGQARIRGLELRRMLQQTAVAITVYGKESIPFRELQLRLKKNRKQTMEAVEIGARERPLTSLMISFYFKGGREHLGCEFLHKSFREYLYAEAIVEMLKDYGQRAVGSPAKREPYWKDFQESDPRRPFSRDLSEILCSYPLTMGIRPHIRGLLRFEIGRSVGRPADQHPVQTLAAVTLAQWKVIRNSLSDLWEWWGEGVHLRPQPYRDASDNLNYHPAFVNELIEYSLPRDRGPDTVERGPARLTNYDANLGEALCQLNAWVHATILQESGWNGVLANRTAGDLNIGERPYQCEYRRSGETFVLFRPSGSAKAYFKNYCARINATGDRSVQQMMQQFLQEQFPAFIDFLQVDLSGASLGHANFTGANFGGANLSKAFLRGAALGVTNLRRADLTEANLDLAHLSGASLNEADLSGASLYKAILSGGADLSGATFNNAKLRSADLRGARLSGADFSGADLNGTDLRGVDLENVRGLTKEQLASAITE